MTLIISTEVTTSQNLPANSDILITSTGSLLVTGPAIQSTDGIHIQNYGFIHGDSGAITAGGTPGSVTMLHNGSGGIITSGMGSTSAVFIQEYHSIFNDGQIGGNLSTASGILVSSGGEIYNTGVISGRSGITDYSAGKFNFLTNSGTIQGSYYALWVQYDTHYTVTNTGTMQGSVKLGNGGNYFDSSLGVVTNGIAGGTGDDVIYAGRGNNAAGGSAGNDTVIGNDGDDSLYGDMGNDVVSGDAGNDRIFVYDGQGSDTLDGGTGTDLLYLERQSATANLTLSLAAPSVEQELGDGTSAVNFEQVQAYAGSGHDNLTGGSLADTLSGGAGNDTLNGGRGSDALLGGAGADSYVVDRLTDKVTESIVSTAAAESDLVTFLGTAGTYTLSANLERLTLGGTGAINGNGNAMANTIIGNAASNILNGGLGVDTLSGMGGSDSYIADVFNDTVIETLGGTAGGVDLVTFAGTTGTFTLGLNVENLTLAGAGAINGAGNAAANILIGNAASNVLAGGLGNDTLKGGAGADFFVFNTAPNATTNRDTITDFSAVDDTIRLENTGIFTALGLATGVLNATLFKNVSLAAVDASDRILYNDGTGAISYDIDGSGAAAAIQIAVISGAPTLTNADFIVI